MRTDGSPISRAGGQQWPPREPWLRRLPIEIKSHCQQIRFRGAEDSFVSRERMDPVEHDAGAVRPVPVETHGEVVVLAAADIIQIQVGPASLGFPGTRADAAGDNEEVSERVVAAELSPVLAEP